MRLALDAARERCGLTTQPTSEKQTLTSSIPTGLDAGERLLAVSVICEGYGSEPPTPAEGYNRPPLVTYTTTPTEHGDVVRATADYVRWYLEAYPNARRADSARVVPPRPVDKGERGKEFGLKPIDF